MKLPFDPAVYPRFSYGERVHLPRYAGCPALVQAYNEEEGTYLVSVRKQDAPAELAESVKGGIIFLYLAPAEIEALK